MKTIRNILIGLLVIVLLTLVYGLGIEPNFIDLEEHRVTIPDLPPAWYNQKIAVLSDFQLGMWMDNDRTIRKAVDEIIRIYPSAVLVLGDFIYHPAEANGNLYQQAAETLAPLQRAGIPVYAVWGNHDWGINHKDEKPNEVFVRQLQQELERVGVIVLQNQAVEMKPPLLANPAEPLYLVGLGSHMAGYDHPDIALAELPAAAARLVMMHNPDSFPLLPARSAPLAVAGHTHGGQVRIPGLPQSSWLTFRVEEQVHTDGWIADDFGEPGNRLYVNRGIGFSILPIRINCPPELTIFTLSGE